MFTTKNLHQCEMKINGLSAVLNMPAALTSFKLNDEEAVHELPPHSPCAAFLVDKYPACPPDWMRSSGKTKSYFVAAKPGSGLWIDFNSCMNHPYHVAVVISIQGVNPITGMACDGARLEQYLEKCPKHNKNFGPDRFCKDCNFRWPKQNYLCTTGTPHGYFWLDGWRSADGIVRQYILTEERMRGVATHKIGDKRVYAIGISFFLSKEQHLQQIQTLLRREDEISWGSKSSHPVTTTFHPVSELDEDCITWRSYYNSSSEINTQSNAQNLIRENNQVDGLYQRRGKSILFTSHTGGISANAKYGMVDGPTKSQHSHPVVVSKKLEVAAGAKINQFIHDDPNGLDFWRDEEEGRLVINYASEVEVEKILAGGVIDLNGSLEGMLQDVPVGNK